MDRSTQIGALNGTSGDIAIGSGIVLTTGTNGTNDTFGGTIHNNGGAGALTKVGTGTFTLSGANTYSNGTTISGGTLTLLNSSTTTATASLGGGGISVGIGATFSVTNSDAVASGSAGSFVLGNVISGAGSVSFGGPSTGITTLTGANTYTGTTTVTAGTLDIQNANALGTADGGTTVKSGATLKVEGDGLTVAEPLTLNGGTLESNATSFNANTLTGSVTLTAASRINSDAGNGGFVIQGTIKGSGQALTLGGAGFMALGGPIQTGAGTLTKVDMGTAALDGTNTYTGLTRVAAGTLFLEVGQAIADTGAVMVDAQATLDVFTSETVGSIAGSGTIALSNSTLTTGGNNAPTIFSGVIQDFSSSAPGSLTKIGTGTFTLSGTNTYTGTTTVSAGTLDIQNANALGTADGGTTVKSGATLKLDGDGINPVDMLTLNGTGVGNGGALRSVSPGANNVQAIVLGSASRINSDAGTLQIDGAITGTNQNLTLGGAGATAIVGAIQTGTGTLTKDGTGLVALFGTNTYTGVTTVSNGILQITGGTAIADTGAVVVNSPGTLQLFASETVGSIAGSGNIFLSSSTLTTGGNNASTTFSGGISNNGGNVSALTKIGTGKLTLSGANIYTGATTVNGYVDNVGDVVNEAANAGTDRVVTTVSYTLAANQSIETFTPVSFGSTTDINLTGNALAQAITGNAGNNTINDGGAGGADTMNGLGGNDTYIVANAGDVVNEAANAGTDHVATSVSYVLKAGQSIETFTPVSFNSTTNINLTGNALAQAITGNAGNNTISDGGAGAADTMSGLGGNDTYIVNNTGDVVSEAANGGTDRVASTVSYTLGAGQSIETLAPTSYSTTTNIDFNGNALAQAIIGNAGKNVIDGKGGNDTLTGGGGNDTFRFDTTPNTASNDPTITDFSVGADMIQLSHAIFSALSPGALGSNAFTVGSGAADADDRIIYNNSTGALTYDTNGNAAGGATQFARLSAGLSTLSASSFQVV